MLLLALDTSTRQASVALCDEERLIGEYTWHVGNNHSVELLVRVQRLFAEGGIALSAVDGLAVAIGPGSFNGVRVAVAAAKTLAFALRKPLIGVSTLEIAAAQYQQWLGPVCALQEAGRAELYAACYVFDSQESAGVVTYCPRQLGDYQVLAPHDLVEYLHEQVTLRLETAGEMAPYLFCGEISVSSRQALLELMPEQAFLGSALQSVRRASVLASLAQQRLLEQRVDDPLLLEPLYIRRPSITSSKRKQSLLGGNASQTNQPNEER
ncbi:MAG: tRNA (adenosine(37)-N6)-threonylcarbamoyltransferase complex dimerization subunit type 1 TsaB [Ktedonobacteraceae bacterium]